MATEEMVELRGKTPRGIVDVIDAVANAKRVDRMDVVNRVLLLWAREQVHVSTVVGNVTRGNPPLLDSNWTPLE